MRRLPAVVALMSLLCSPLAVGADDHLVTPQASRTRLAGSTTQREQDLQTVARVLSRPEASAAVSRMGLAPEQVQSRLAALGDQDLRDLAARAAALDRDPVAGYYDSDVHDLMVILLVVVIVVVLLSAVN